MPRLQAVERYPRDQLDRAAQLLLDIIADVARKRAGRPAAGKVPADAIRAHSLDGRVLAALTQHGAMRPCYLRALLGASAMTLSRSLSRLRAGGQLQATGQTKDRRYMRVGGVKA